MGCIGDISILTSCEYNFIRVHKKMVQHPSNNNISMVILVTTIIVISKSESRNLQGGGMANGSLITFSTFLSYPLLQVEFYV